MSFNFANRVVKGFAIACGILVGLLCVWYLFFWAIGMTS